MNLDVVNQKISYLDGLLKAPLYDNNGTKNQNDETLSQYLTRWNEVMERHGELESLESIIKSQTNQISPGTILEKSGLAEDLPAKPKKLKNQLLDEIIKSHQLEGNSVREADYTAFESDCDDLTKSFDNPCMEKTVGHYLVGWLNQNGRSGLDHWIDIPFIGWEGLQVMPESIRCYTSDGPSPRPPTWNKLLLKAYRLHSISEKYKEMRQEAQKDKLTRGQLGQIQGWIQDLRGLFAYSDLSPLEKYARAQGPSFTLGNDRMKFELSPSSIILNPAYAGLTTALELQLRLRDCVLDECGRMFVNLKSRAYCSEVCIKQAHAIARKTDRRKKALSREKAYTKVIMDIVRHPRDESKSFEAYELCQMVDLDSIPEQRQKNMVKPRNFSNWLSENNFSIRENLGIDCTRKKKQKIWVYQFRRIADSDSGSARPTFPLGN